MKYTHIFILTLLIITSCNNNDDSGGNTPFEEEISVKKIIDIGDSLTAGAGGNGVNMSSVTYDLLSQTWDVLNMGVGGENTLTIGGRYGSIPFYINEDITFTSSENKKPLNFGIFSTWNDENVYPMLQGDAGINPCIINGIKCNISLENNIYYIEKIDSTTINSIPSNSIIYTNLSNQTEGVVTIFIGQNGGYDSPNDFLLQIDKFIEHKGDQNFIIITSHGNGDSQTISPIINKYGNKVIDLKSYMSNYAIYDAIEIGLLPNDGTYPTVEDLEKMNNGETPTSLLVDSVHFNNIGYELLGRLRYNKGQELGYW